MFRTSLGLLAAFAFLHAAAKDEQPAKEEVYELPPFVAYNFVNGGTSWRYGEIPGFEILTQCSDRETREIVAALWRGPYLALPEPLRPHFSLPMTVVLFNQPGMGGASLPSFGSVRGVHEIQSHWTNLIKRTLEDRESFALNLWPGSFSYSSAFRFDQFTLFYRRTPAAPVWLREGLFGRYGVLREGVYWQAASNTKGVHIAAWCSPDEIKQAVAFDKQLRKSRAGRKSIPKTSPLLNLLPEFPVLFERAPPAADDPLYPRWAATVALFVRWGTYDCGPAQVDQFWRFAERACTEVVTETLFKECFDGRSYEDIRRELSWYLPHALQQDGEAEAPVIPPLPKLKLTEATAVQIARVRGEWERMEGAALKAKFPEIAQKYREQAARSLALSAQKSSLDPRIRASRGLLALDNGDPAAARGHLEFAVAGNVPGPRPYLELARLRWDADRLDDAGTLPPAALAAISSLLLTAERQPPALASIYLLLAEVVVRSPQPPSLQQSAALERGRLAFPTNPVVQAALARVRLKR